MKKKIISFLVVGMVPLSFSGFIFLFSAPHAFADTASSSAAIAIPTDITPTAETTSTISLSWTESSAQGGTIAGYYIYRNGTQIGTSAGTTFIDRGLVPSTAYFYTIVAYDANGNVSSQSEKTGATTSYLSSQGDTSSVFASNLSQGISSYFFPAPPTVSISAKPTTITQGQGTTISWKSANTSACIGSGAFGGGSLGINGSLLQTPTDTGTYTYTITCSGSGGVTSPASVVVEVGAGVPVVASSSSSDVPGNTSGQGDSAAQFQLLKMQLLQLLIGKLQILLQQAKAQGISLPSGASAYL